MNCLLSFFSRIDVNSSKDAKQQTIFPCLEENEVEKMARAHKSSCCSCSPPTSPSTSSAASDENSEKNDENEEEPAKIQQQQPEAIISKEFQQPPDLNTFSGVLMASKS